MKRLTPLVEYNQYHRVISPSVRITQLNTHYKCHYCCCCCCMSQLIGRSFVHCSIMWCTTLYLGSDLHYCDVRRRTALSSFHTGIVLLAAAAASCRCCCCRGCCCCCCCCCCCSRCGVLLLLLLLLLLVVSLLPPTPPHITSPYGRAGAMIFLRGAGNESGWRMELILVH